MSLIEFVQIGMLCDTCIFFFFSSYVYSVLWILVSAPDQAWKGLWCGFRGNSICEVSKSWGVLAESFMLCEAVQPSKDTVWWWR